MNVADVIEEKTVSAHLLDCATMLTTNFFFHLMKEQFDEDYEVIDKEIARLSEKEKEDIEAKLLIQWEKILVAANIVPRI